MAAVDIVARRREAESEDRGRDESKGDTGHPAVGAAEGMISHQLTVLGERADEGQEHEEENRIQRLGQKEDRDKRCAGDQHHRRRNGGDGTEAQVEGSRLGEAVVDVGFLAEGL